MVVAIEECATAWDDRWRPAPAGERIDGCSDDVDVWERVDDVLDAVVRREHAREVDRVLGHAFAAYDLVTKSGTTLSVQSPLESARATQEALDRRTSIAWHAAAPVTHSQSTSTTLQKRMSRGSE